MIPRKTYLFSLDFTQSSFSRFNGSINSGNDLENLLKDYQNAQFSIEEATEGLFSFNQADKLGFCEKKKNALLRSCLRCTC